MTTRGKKKDGPPDGFVEDTLTLWKPAPGENFEGVYLYTAAQRDKKRRAWYAIHHFADKTTGEQISIASSSIDRIFGVVDDKTGRIAQNAPEGLHVWILYEGTQDLGDGRVMNRFRVWRAKRSR